MSSQQDSSHFQTSSSNYTAERPVTYMCNECNSDVVLKRGDPLRCTACGHRVLQKKRTTRMVQFEAR